MDDLHGRLLVALPRRDGFSNRWERRRPALAWTAFEPVQILAVAVDGFGLLAARMACGDFAIEAIDAFHQATPGVSGVLDNLSAFAAHASTRRSASFIV